MQRRFGMFVAIILIGLLALTIGALAQRGSAASSQTKASESDTSDHWEYLVVSGGRANLSGIGSDTRMRKQPDDSFAQEAIALERNFDKLGVKGWELVSVHGTPNEPVYYFKRLKR